jgi:hypothetical protein
MVHTLRTKMVKPEHNPLGCEAALRQDLVDLVGGEIRVGIVVHPLRQRLTLSGLGNTSVADPDPTFNKIRHKT